MAELFEGVLIAGAGPVGLLTALRLARAGIPIAIIEAEPAIIASPRAIVYHPPTIKLLDELGVFEDAKAIGIVKHDYQFRERDTGAITRMNSALLVGHTDYPFNLHLGQHELAEIILKHLSRLPGIEVRWNSRVQAVTQESGRVTVTVEAGSGTYDVSTPWLLAADGARSGVRRVLGLEFAGHTWPDRFMATNIYYDFEAHGFAQANFIIDPVNWAIIPKINAAGLWRVTYGKSADIPEDEALRRVPDRIRTLLPGPELLSSSPLRPTASTNGPSRNSGSVTSYWSAMPPMSAIRPAAMD